MTERLFGGTVSVQVNLIGSPSGSLLVDASRVMVVPVVVAEAEADNRATGAPLEERGSSGRGTPPPPPPPHAAIRVAKTNS